MEKITEINDIRTINDFKGITFSNFKKTEVIKQLLINLTESKIEQSNYWSCELIASGHFLSLWDLIIQFYAKYIQISNPKLCIYLDIRLTYFKKMLNNVEKLQLRNNINIRKLFSEIICIICLSKKNHTFQEIKINPEHFVLINIADKLKAPNINYIQDFFKENDPKELFIQFNEFVYNIDIKNCIESCYWFEYIINYEVNMRKNKKKCICENRFKNFINLKNQSDIIWIFWEIIYKYSQKNKLFHKIVESSFNLFTINYISSNIKHKRKFLIYFVITLITSNIFIDENIIKNKEQITFVLSNIDKLYIQIKNNEVKHNDENIVSKNKISKNMEKTIFNLNKMNSFTEIYIPRDEKNEIIKY